MRPRVRSIRPSVDADAWVSSGRWGPRRVRVEDCATLRAEDVYTDLLRGDPESVRPGLCGLAKWTVFGRTFSTDWHVRPNAVWRSGRVFLTCPRCDGRVTRVYVPCASAWAACRRCWGLTYGSRSLAHYGLSRWFAFSVAASQTLFRQERRAEASAVRYAERRRLREASSLSPSNVSPSSRAPEIKQA